MDMALYTIYRAPGSTAWALNVKIYLLKSIKPDSLIR